MISIIRDGKVILFNDTDTTELYPLALHDSHQINGVKVQTPSTPLNNATLTTMALTVDKVTLILDGVTTDAASTV